MSGGIALAVIGSLFSTFTVQEGILLVAILAALAVVRPGSVPQGMRITFFIIEAIALVILVIINSQLLWLSLAVFVMILAALRFEPREHFQHAFVIIVIALVFALIGSRLPNFGHVSIADQPSISATLTTAQGTLHGIQSFFGSGPATFAYDFAAFRPQSVNATNYWASSLPQGHDFLATLLATGGIAGCLLFLLFALLAIQPFLHISLLDTEVAMAASASAFLIAALLLYPASFAALLLLFALLGILSREWPHRTIVFETLSRPGSLTVSALVMVLAAACLAGMFVIGEKYSAAILLGQAINLENVGNLNAAFTDINSAVDLDRTDVYYRNASTILISEAKIIASSQNTASLSTAIASAIQAASTATSLNPQDPSNWGNLGFVYESVMPILQGSDGLAVQSYEKAAMLDPANPQWDLAIARVFIEAASLLPSGASNNQLKSTAYADAEQFLSKAIALKNDYADARVMLVELYVQEGNLPQAISKVQELVQENPLDPGAAFELGYLYYQNGQVSEAQQEFQNSVILDPNYSNALYFLGLTYSDQGMYAQALQAFQRIQFLNPGNEQVAGIVANLQAGRPALANNAASSTLSVQQPVIPTVTPPPTAPSAPGKKGK